MAGIFKAYDIRGAYPDEINEEIVQTIGNAFIHYLSARHIVVGRDMRLSSDSLAEHFIAGAAAAGATVTDIGRSTTPQLYFSIIEGQFDGGAMITASHLPANMNGIKLCREQAIPLSRDAGLGEVEHQVMAGKPTPAGAAGKCVQASFFDAYIAKLAGMIREPRRMTVAVDAGNGMAGRAVQAIIAHILPWHLIPLYFEPDGHFPHHVANPLLPDTTRELQARVMTDHADLGVAFDGDADRCGFIDEQGHRIHQDIITALIAEYFLTVDPHATIVYDLRSSHVVPDTIRRLHGAAVRSRVGHSFIKEKMREVNAVFAGELSGHYYYRELGFIDDAMLTMILLLNILARKQQAVSQVIAPLQVYCDSGEINFSVRDCQAIFSALEHRYADGKQDHLDGITIEYADWWFNLRSSHTEPVIRLNLEAQDCQEMQRKRDEVIAVIHQADATAKKAA